RRGFRCARSVKRMRSIDLWGAGCDGWHLVKADGFSVIHERMPAGAAELRHYHERARQLFFVLSSRAELEARGETGCSDRRNAARNASRRPASNENTSDFEVIVPGDIQPPNPGRSDRMLRHIT